MGPLDGQIALVTGASGAVGGAVALALIAAGARVFMLGRNAAALEAARRAATGPHRPELVILDLTEDAAVLGLPGRIQAKAGRLDMLVHCAGVFSHASVDTASISDLDAQYRVNLRAPYLLTHALLPLLRASRGQMVFVNSTAGLAAHAGISQYAATKAGLRAMAEALRAEVAPQGIRVLSLFLGRTASAMQRRVHELEGAAYHPEGLLQPAEVATLALSLLTLPRGAEVGNVVLRPSVNAT